KAEPASKGLLRSLSGMHGPFGNEPGSQRAMLSQKVIKFSKLCVAGKWRSRGSVISHCTLLPDRGADEKKPILGSPCPIYTPLSLPLSFPSLKSVHISCALSGF